MCAICDPYSFVVRHGGFLRLAVALSVCGFASTNAFATDSVYGLSASEGVFSVDVNTRVTTFLFDPPGSWRGATDGDNATSFFATKTGESLYRIDIQTQTVTAIGSYGAVAIRELAYNDSTGILYGTDYSALYQIDRNTGTPTLIGSFGGGLASMWALDYDAAIDSLVGHNEQNDTLYRIDRTSGQATVIANTGISRLADLWYSKTDGLLYGVEDSIGGDNFWRIHSTTGQATFLGTLPNNPGLTGLGTPVPEPCTLFLLLLGGICWRKRDIITHL